jgi:hypothetical protein
MTTYSLASSYQILLNTSLNNILESVPLGTLANTVTSKVDITTPSLYSSSGSLNGTSIVVSINAVTQSLNLTGSSNAASYSALVTAINAVFPTIASVNSSSQLQLSSTSSMSITGTADAVLHWSSLGLVVGTTADQYAYALLGPNFVAPITMPSEMKALNSGSMFRSLTSTADGTVIVNTPFRNSVTKQLYANTPLYETFQAVLPGGTAVNISGGF